jgi:predicted MPP superfamily phosphohydrolase
MAAKTRSNLTARADVAGVMDKMQVAALYDIHGNLFALQAALREVRDAHVDLIVVGGDVLPGPMPARLWRA